MKLSALSLFGLLAAAVSAVPVKRGLPRLGGVNLAGCEFGMNVWGWAGTSYCPDTTQISHFVNHGANVVRIPFGWQYMVTNQDSTTLIDSYFQQYDKLVKATTATGAYAILDLHNYGRWNSAVVGVDGPSNEAFGRLWGLLAAKYANNPLVMFGLMNEPHDQDIGKFATSCQVAVNAIRAAGAKSQTIILPGNSWDNAAVWASGANDAMLQVTDPASSDKSALILDVHKYIDGDGSGTSHTCTNNGLDMLQPLVTYLKSKGRKAILTEMGGADTDSCRTLLPQMMDYVVANSDYFVGFTAWSAGNFAPYPGYELSIVPNADGSDNQLFLKAIKPYLPGVKATVTSTTVAPSSTSKAASSTSSAAPKSSSVVVASSAPATSSAAVTSAAPLVTSSAAPKPSSAAPVVSSAAPVVPSSAAPVVPSSAAPKPSAVAPSSAAPVAPSSAAPVASSAAPVVPAPSSAAPVVTPVPSPAAPSSAAPATTSAAAPVAGNLQTFSEALGGFTAPAVTKEGNYWYIGTQRYNFLIDALNQSCYKQMDACQLNANRGGNVEPLTVANCNGPQIAACLKNAAATAA